MKIATSNGNVPSLSMFTPPQSPTVTNSHSDENHLNTPERILAELHKTKKKIKDLEAFEAVLKGELETHYERNNIRGKFTSNGVMAVRQKREGKWVYSEFTELFEAKHKKEIEDQKAMEREDGVARQNEGSFAWAIREEKK